MSFVARNRYNVPLAMFSYLTNILRAVVGVTHWNVRAQPELGLECAAETMYGHSPY